MDAKQFDELVARLAEGPSRRDALKGAIGGALATIGISAALDDADAKGKGKGKGKGGGGRGAEAEKHKHKRNKHAAKKCKKGRKHCGNKKKCFDLQTNPDHCGNCGTSCLSTEQCVAGVCTPLT